MVFKVKDLMVNALPSSPAEQLRHKVRDIYSPEPTEDLIELASTASVALSKLQEQLKLYLELQQLQGAIEKTSPAKTIKEIDSTTEKLVGALTSLKARRAELSKKPTPAKRK
jgi:hypothetical protein